MAFRLVLERRRQRFAALLAELTWTAGRQRLHKLDGKLELGPEPASAALLAIVRLPFNRDLERLSV